MDMAHFFPVTATEGKPDAEQSLARAFATFTEVAGSLERSYAELQIEVARLRQELEITNRDLTRSLEENRRTREHLHQILESLPCGVIVTSASGTIYDANAEAKRLISGQNIPSIEQFPASLTEVFAKARHDGNDHDWCDDRPGSMRWLAIRHASLSDTDGTKREVYILRDTSEQKMLEREREKLRQQQALVEVSTLLAHEIRNPLGSLELFAGLLAESDLSAETKGWVEHVQAGLRTMAATVNNVLHLHDAPLTITGGTNLGELLRWAHGFLLPVARQARIQLEVIHQLDGVVVAADRHRLEQVLLNLALNAVRFMPGGGWLSLRGRVRNAQGGEFVELSVIDTGPGIEQENLGRIFEAGFSTRPGSPGLGLAVARKIVEGHGGTLTVESRPGHGARFHIRIPLPGGQA